MERFAEKKAKLFGNHVLLVTPLTPTGGIDVESTKSLVDYVVDKGVHGILALGSTGEVFCLTDDERKQFAEVVIKHANGRVPVGVGVIHSASDTSAVLAKHAAGAGKRALKWMGVIAHDTCKPVMEPIDDIRARELRAVLERIGKL